jgi:hypothetical protein
LKGLKISDQEEKNANPVQRMHQRPSNSAAPPERRRDTWIGGHHTCHSPGGGETVHHCGSLNAGDPVERAPRQKIIRTIIMIFSVIGIIIIIIFVNM